MGYISFAKASGEVDLLPAENIVHVGAATNTAIVIEYGISAGNAATSLQATVTYATVAGIVDADVRKKVNAAIEKANGAAGPAIPVGLPTLVSSVAIAFA